MFATRIELIEVARNEMVAPVSIAVEADLENGNGFENNGGCRLLFIPDSSVVAGTITIHNQNTFVKPLGGRYGSVVNPAIEIEILYDDHIQVYECALPAGRFNLDNSDVIITYAGFGETDVLHVVVLKEVC